MLGLKTTPWDVVEHLKTEEDMALYLEAALDDGDPTVMSAVIGDIARARGLATCGDSDLAGMLRVIKAAGLRLRVSVGR
jgi:DNA-binding phage protein